MNEQTETRAQAVERWHRDGGNEADYTRRFPIKGTTETLTHCQICLAHLENGFIKHLHYCPFEGAADKASGSPEGDRLREAAPALLAALTEPLADSPTFSFADDLDILATLVDSFGWHPTGDALRAKAQAIRAAIARVKGE